jgi:hypothetical protein
MSALSKTTTKLKDAEEWVSALKAHGYQPEVHATAQIVNGYGVQKATIILRRAGACLSDIGWIMNANGTLDEISDQDGHSPFDQKRDALNVTYAEGVVKKTFAALGLKPYKSKKVNAKGETKFSYIR